MKNKIKITFDSSFANIDEAPASAKREIKEILTYTDNSIAYTNKFTKFYKDPNKCLLKGSRFYTGLLPRVVVALGKSYEFEYDNQIEPIEFSRLELPDWLYDHQREMLDTALDFKRGIIQSPTGSGKTLTMTYLVKHFPAVGVLITVPNVDLLVNTKEVLESQLGEDVGMIGGGKKSWKRVTVGVINSLSKIAKQDPTPLSGFRVLICDEVHRVGDNFYIDLCEALPNTDFRIGFSATAWRNTGDNKVLEGLIGPIVKEVEEETLVEKGILVKPQYLVVDWKSPDNKYKGYNQRARTYFTPNNKPDRNEVVDACIVYNKKRNEAIVDLAVKYINNKQKLPGIILVDRIEHGKILKEMLDNAGYDVPFVHGKSKKKERKQFIMDLRKCDIKLGIGSRILNEGQDVPSLLFAILAGGGSSDIKIIQQVGRLVRKHPDKDTAILVDFRDSEPYYLSFNAKKRHETIEKLYNNSVQNIKLHKLHERIEAGFSSVC